MTITLTRGYKDQDDVEHRDVTFGRRVAALDLFALDGDKQSEISTQRVSLLVSRAITKFGSLTMPVPLKVLLSLTRTDREDLLEAYDVFAIASAGERKAEFLPNHKVRLPFGFNINGTLYDVAEFGKEITGYDEVDADREGLTGLSHECFLIGREIARLSKTKQLRVSEGDTITQLAARSNVTPDELARLNNLAVDADLRGGEELLLLDRTQQIDGPVLLSDFESLDGADIINLRIASQIWRSSFRRRGATVQRDSGTGGAGDSAGDKGMEREGHTESPNNQD